MSQGALVLTLLNIVCGLLIFFAMSGITSWAVFSTPSAKILPFILGILLLGNGVYLALSSGSGLLRRR